VNLSRVTWVALGGLGVWLLALLLAAFLGRRRRLWGDLAGGLSLAGVVLALGAIFGALAQTWPALPAGPQWALGTAAVGVLWANLGQQRRQGERALPLPLPLWGLAVGLATLAVAGWLLWPLAPDSAWLPPLWMLLQLGLLWTAGGALAVVVVSVPVDDRQAGTLIEVSRTVGLAAACLAVTAGIAGAWWSTGRLLAGNSAWLLLAGLLLLAVTAGSGLLRLAAGWRRSLWVLLWLALLLATIVPA